MPWWSPSAIAIALGVVVVVLELKTGDIPNWLSLPTFAFGLLAGLLDKHIGDHLAGAIAAVLLTAILYRQDWLGGGGVKWTCAVSALIGFRLAAFMMMVAAVLAVGVLGLAKLRKRELFVPSSPLVLSGVVAAVANVLVARH